MGSGEVIQQQSQKKPAAVTNGDDEPPSLVSVPDGVLTQTPSSEFLPTAKLSSVVLSLQPQLPTDSPSKSAAKVTVLCDSPLSNGTAMQVKPLTVEELATVPPPTDEKYAGVAVTATALESRAIALSTYNSSPGSSRPVGRFKCSSSRPAAPPSQQPPPLPTSISLLPKSQSAPSGNVSELFRALGKGSEEVAVAVLDGGIKNGKPVRSATLTNGLRTSPNGVAVTACVHSEPYPVEVTSEHHSTFCQMLCSFDIANNSTGSLNKCLFFVFCP